MEDLLSPSEIDALLNRLHSLQTHLQNEQTKLLDPDEWNEATAKGMLDESKASPSRSQKSKDPNLKMTGSYHRELLRWL
jgi:flagellar motor switch protein FliM